MIIKKTISVLFSCVVLFFSSCTRTEIADPEWNDPAGFYILLEGSANPAVFFIDGDIHTSKVYVRVTDSKGAPRAGETIFFEQLPDSLTHQQVEWGYFENNAPTIKKVTNSNGEVQVKFYSPVKFYSGGMIIHAVMEVDGRAYRGSASHVGTVPQDYIAITMYNSSSLAGAAE